MFRNTYRAVVEGKPFDPAEIISICPELKELVPLSMELSQPTYTPNKAGKIVINKAPDGTKSPNLADAVMICFCPKLGNNSGLMGYYGELMAQQQS